MKDLGKLVPSLDLCRKIPKGNLSDSILVWIHEDFGGEYIVEEKLSVTLRCIASEEEVVAPAPTLQEILVSLDAEKVFFVVAPSPSTWQVIYHPAGDADVVKNISLPDSALEAWLKVKGIGIEKKTQLKPLENLRKFIEAECSGYARYYTYKSDDSILVYVDDKVQVYKCSKYEYIDIIGLSRREEIELENMLNGGNRKCQKLKN